MYKYMSIILQPPASSYLLFSSVTTHTLTVITPLSALPCPVIKCSHVGSQRDSCSTATPATRCATTISIRKDWPFGGYKHRLAIPLPKQILYIKISVLLLLFRQDCATPSLDSETGWTVELWSRTNLLKEQN